MQFSNRGIRPLSGSPRKGKRKNRSAGSFTGFLQDYSDDYKSTLVPGTSITQRRLVFDDYVGSGTGT